MTESSNKYIAVAYKLYTVENGNESLVEEAPSDKPFQFISGFGIALEEFEKQIVNIEKGGTFDFTLTPDQAYGEFFEERVLDLEKDIFSINGHFDHENVFKDAIIPLQNEDGNRFMGHVLEITEDKVKIDLNHPLAGKTLHFEGSIVEAREATNEEIEGMVNRMSGEGGCCGGGNCDCGGDNGGCGCGHEHGHHDHEHKHDCCGGHHDCHCSH